MKLLDLYSRSCGLRIGRQWLLESFYPIPTTKYITLHASSGMTAKNYPYYQEVVILLLPILNAQGIQIVQLGGKEDTRINGSIDLRGKTNYHQSAYILRNSLCHVGNDSWLMHRAGDLGIPLVDLFGSTSVKNHSPYHYNAAKTVFLESHRWGRQPTFAAQEQPLSISLIPPDQVVNAVLRLVGIQDQLPFSALFVGSLYQHAVLELIPNCRPAPGLCPELPIMVRMDLLFNEEILLNLLQTGRKVNLITRREVNVQILGQHRGSILTYSHEIVIGEEPTLPYVDTIRSLFPTNHAFFTRSSDEKAVADLRFRFFDHAVIGLQKDTTKEDYVLGALAYLNRPDTPENRLDIETKLGHTRFKSNKYVLAADKAHLSHAHLAANQAIPSLDANSTTVIDDLLFWRDIQHYLFAYYP